MEERMQNIVVKYPATTEYHAMAATTHKFTLSQKSLQTSHVALCQEDETSL